jgi:adenylosuccinate lyase
VDAKNRPYSTFHLVEFLPISRSSIAQWIKGDLIPGIKDTNSRLNKSIFSVDEIYTIALFCDLLKWGMTREDASEISQRAEMKDWEKIKDKKDLLVIYKEETNFGHKFIKTFEQLTAIGGTYLIVNLKDLIRRVDEGTAKIDRKLSRTKG